MDEPHAQRLSSSVAILHGANTKDNLESALVRIRDLYGFANLAFLSIGISGVERPRMVYCTTYPEEWTSRYMERNYFEIDPVIAIYRTRFMPVDWAELGQTSQQAREFFREAVQMGVGRNGVTVPVRGPAGTRSLFSATSNVSRREWRNLRASIKHDMMLLSHYMHEKFLAVMGARTHNYKDLSRRERECLELIARGVVPKRIASNLKLSESAVRLYLTSAKRKLNSATIYQAIARASFLELIDV